MDLNAFLQSRQPRWQRLTQILDRIDAQGLPSLSPVEVDEFFRLYRLVSSDLNLVQTRTGNPSLLDYLEALVARAYAHLSVPRKSSFFRSWWLIMRHYFPASVRVEWKVFALSAAIMCGGTAFGYVATFASPHAAELFLPEEHLVESPKARVARLEEMERTGNSRVSTVDQHTYFTVFLFNNNIRVGIVAFALGLTFGVGTTIALFYNGAMLGSLAYLYYADGVMTFFIAWVGPHGSIELPCIIFAGAAGFMLARTQFRPGEGSVTAQIRRIRPRLIDIVVGASTLLILAGAIEGGFSQINEPTLPYPLKIAVAVALLGMLLAYLFWMPAKPRPVEEE